MHTDDASDTSMPSTGEPDSEEGEPAPERRPRPMSRDELRRQGLQHAGTDGTAEFEWCGVRYDPTGRR